MLHGTDRLGGAPLIEARAAGLATVAVIRPFASPSLTSLAARPSAAPQWRASFGRRAPLGAFRMCASTPITVRRGDLP